jgi:hypothetical protein
MPPTCNSRPGSGPFPRGRSRPVETKPHPTTGLVDAQRQGGRQGLIVPSSVDVVAYRSTPLPATRPHRAHRGEGGGRLRRRRRVGAVDAQLVNVLAREVEQLPPAELLDLLDRRRHHERPLGLLGGTTELVVKDPQRGSPRIRPAFVQVRVQHLQRLRNKLIERRAAGLLDGRLPRSSTETARPSAGASCGPPRPGPTRSAGRRGGYPVSPRAYTRTKAWRHVATLSCRDLGSEPLIGRVSGVELPPSRVWG